MALVSCTCAGHLTPTDTGMQLVVIVADPDCPYVLHRTVT